MSGMRAPYSFSIKARRDNARLESFVNLPHPKTVTTLAFRLGRRRSKQVGLGLIVSLLAFSCFAHPLKKEGEPDEDKPQELPEVRVRASLDNIIGTTDAASEGTISAARIQVRPVLRPADLLESIPGLVVTQHSGDGKANQYFLRGFNLDHGTDFSTTVAGVPVNLPTHAHGHGYTDLNFLLPELVDRIDYRKGPYFSSNGDFSSAGSAAIRLRNVLPEPYAQLSIGQFGYRRLFSAGSTKLTSGANLLAGLELASQNGPWENPEGLRKVNGVLRYSQGSYNDGFDVTLMAYQSRWNSTDQIPQRAIDSGTIARFGAVDPSAGGQTSRYSLSTQWRKPLQDGSVQASAYLLRYELDLYSNFSYFRDNPIQGDQFLQKDSRTVFGAEAKRIWATTLAGMETHYELGLQARHDRIRVGLFDSTSRTVTATTRDDRVSQTSLGLFGEAGITWTPWLRSTAGLRADHFRWDVQNQLAGSAGLNSGNASSTLASPKLAVIFGPWSKTEYFLNWGRGFHSNDGRGTVTRIDPKSGGTVSPVTGLVRTTGYEFGVRSQIVPNLQTSLALWRLAIGSELVFVGDAGTTEASRPSVRQGIELNNRYSPLPWLDFNLDLALSRARFTDADPAGPYVPGSVARVASASVSVQNLGAWSGSLQARYIGPRPLVEDNAVMAASSTLLNMRLGYRVKKGFDISLDMFNLANRKVNDIEYYYASRLKGESTEQNDRHVHPAEPRSVRLSARLEF
jgi:outer membrane receptor protein involved in Fe transport